MFRIISAVLVSMATAAHAANDSKPIDFTQPFVDEGKVIVDEISCPADRQTGSRPCKTPFTLGEAAYRALRAPEQGLSWDEGTKRDDLAHAVRKATDWPLLPSDCKLIEKVLAKVYPSPALIGPASKMLGDCK